jgi:hypothetical protein
MRKERHPCLTSEQATLATGEARSLTSPGPQVPVQSMAATFNPIPALATVSLGKVALRSAATMLCADLEPDGIRVATLTIAGQIVAGTSFAPERIAERYWEVVHVDGPWQAEFRFIGE